jgi:hypothetical protein
LCAVLVGGVWGAATLEQRLHASEMPPAGRHEEGSAARLVPRLGLGFRVECLGLGNSAPHSLVCGGTQGLGQGRQSRRGYHGGRVSPRAARGSSAARAACTRRAREKRRGADPARKPTCSCQSLRAPGRAPHIGLMGHAALRATLCAQSAKPH